MACRYAIISFRVTDKGTTPTDVAGISHSYALVGTDLPGLTVYTNGDIELGSVDLTGIREVRFIFEAYPSSLNWNGKTHAISFDIKSTPSAESVVWISGSATKPEKEGDGDGAFGDFSFDSKPACKSVGTDRPVVQFSLYPSKLGKPASHAYSIATALSDGSDKLVARADPQIKNTGTKDLDPPSFPLPFPPLRMGLLVGVLLGIVATRLLRRRHRAT